MSKKRVALVGISVQCREGHVGANLALYNLKNYSQTDPILRDLVLFKIFDFTPPQSIREMVRCILKFEPDAVGLSCYLWNTDDLIAIAKGIKEVLPHAVLVLGGPDAGPRADLLLKRYPFIDAIAKGEGEECFRLLLRRLVGLDKPAWWHTKGFYINHADQYYDNPVLPPINLDNVPSVLDDQEFLCKYESLIIESARGCNFHCAYCLYSSIPRHYRSLSLILRELDIFAKRGGRSVAFIDAGFNQNRQRFRTILDYLSVLQGLKIESLEINLDLLEEEDIGLLENKVEELGIGLQSTNPVALRNIGRSGDYNLFDKRVRQLQANGLNYTLDVIYGLPGDNYESFLCTLDDAYALRPTRVNIFRLQVLPGIRLEREKELWNLKFDKNPPYFLSSCSSFSADGMKAAECIAKANQTINLYSPDSKAFQLTMQWLDKQASVLLEAFLNGAWRREGVVSSEELNSWSTGRDIESLRVSLTSWLEYCFGLAGQAKVCPEVTEAFDLQFAFALATSQLFYPHEYQKQWPPHSSAVPEVSPNAQIVMLESSRRAFIVLNTGEKPKRIKIPIETAEILLRIDGRISLKEFLNVVLGKSAEDLCGLLLGVLKDLTHRGVLFWHNRSLSEDSI